MRNAHLLKKLHLAQLNEGACTGANGWSAQDGASPIVSRSPATNEPIAAVLPAGEADYARVAAAAVAAFERWRTVPAPRRGELVRQLGEALRENKEPLGELVSLEMGKIRAEGLGEVQEMIDICDFAVGLSRQLYGNTMHSERPGHRMYEQWHPLGPVGVISSFNFPVAVWSWNAAIAAVCGDPVIWKPSSSTPLAAVAVQHLCNRVSADFGMEGLFNLVVGPGRTVGERLVNDQRVPLVSFTGSTKMGVQVAKALAGRLGRSILELGGNNAIVVTENADLDLAVRAVLFGAVGTAGQRCTSTRRLIVHKSLAPDLERRLVAAYGQLRVGDPLDDGTHVGPLIDENAVDEMMAAIERAKAEGGTVVVGGERLSMGPCFASPAIVRMPAQTEVVQTETFAPILYVLSFETMEEALHLHNQVPQGLSSAIFTTDMREAERFLSHAGSDCGIANVNLGTSGAEIGGAFGGEKETGGGREAGSDAWKAYMRRQTNTLNWSSELPLAQGIEFDLS